ncbi:MAG: 4-hydroxy-3-methylbut-2-enyl diphosphate reductase [Ignavibacteria bacterium]|jgi:4-hydroxy-3-methylbut-2-enyl diphosphate reductase
MKKFDIPIHYKSSIISRIKELRKIRDPRKRDFTPTHLDFGPVEFIIARHFGFCYGVENAIEIAYKTIEENPGKRIFLLSEMIHNPGVNGDLKSRGINFIMDTEGNKYIDLNEITKDDIVLTPAFGTTVEMENTLREKGIAIEKYDTTCPFVEKVWKRANTIGKDDYTVVIHGKHKHEETRATFSHTVQNAHAVIVRDLEETKLLGNIILGEIKKEEFYKLFEDKYSPGFDVDAHLSRIGVVNQTTMLSNETQEIADHLIEVMIKKFGIENIDNHFADTRDTLCYATNDNQKATYGLLEDEADFAVVVGGYNSSNTSHIVELLESKFKTYFISSPDKIISKNIISHFDIHIKRQTETKDFIPQKDKVKIVLTSGASCPDSMIDVVLNKFLPFWDNCKSINEAIDGVF